MAKGTRPKTERNRLIVELRDKPLRRGERQLSFAKIGQMVRPRITAQSAHEIYTREKKREQQEVV